MAYRRRQGITKASTFITEDLYRPVNAGSPLSSPSLTAPAMPASVVYRDSASSVKSPSPWEERTNIENKTVDVIQETRKLQIRRKDAHPGEQSQFSDLHRSLQLSSTQSAQPQTQTNCDQLRASRDVAVATAAKAKLVLIELKTVKADLAFAKERCSQLEEENRLLREAHEKGVNPADDDMIRVQLETLLEEKARLAHENSIYARENRFLREIIEYHQLIMQNVVYLDEGTGEPTEVYPMSAVFQMLSASPPSPASPRSPCEISSSRSSSVAKEMVSASIPPRTTDVSHINEDSTRH